MLGFKKKPPSDVAKNRLHRSKNRPQIRLSLMLLLFFPLWAHAMNSETAVAAGDVRATLPNVLSATGGGKRKQPEKTQGTSSMRNRQPRSTKKAKKRENGQSSSPSGSSDMDTDNTEDVSEAVQSAARDVMVEVWREFELFANNFFRCICRTEDGDALPQSGGETPLIPEEAVGILRRGRNVYDTCDHEDLQREIGILGVDRAKGTPLDVAGCREELEELAARERRRGYGVDAIVVVRDDDGKIVDVLLLQHKHYKKIANADLKTLKRTQFLVKKKLGLEHKPLVLLVCPTTTIFSKDENAMFFGEQAMDDRLYAVKLKGFVAKEDTKKATPSATPLTLEERRKKLRDERDTERKPYVEELGKLWTKYASALQLLTGRNNPALNLAMRDAYDAAVRKAALPDGKTIRTFQERARLMLKVLIGLEVQPQEFFYVDVVEERMKQDPTLPSPWWPTPAEPTEEEKKRRENLDHERQLVFDKYEELDSEKKSHYAAKCESFQAHKVFACFAPTACGKTAVAIMGLQMWFKRVRVRTWKGTEAAQEHDKPRVAVVFGKYLDCLRQMETSCEVCLAGRFGADWRSKVRYIASKDELNLHQTVYSKEECAQAVDDGVRVFFCTEQSADKGLAVVERALDKNYEVLGIKDEAHNNDDWEKSDSAKAMKKIAEGTTSRRRCVALFATATPTERLQNQLFGRKEGVPVPENDTLKPWHAVQGMKMTLRDAIDLRIVADYRVFTMELRRREEEGWRLSSVRKLEAESSDLAFTKKVNCAVKHMKKRARRSIGFCKDGTEANKIKAEFERLARAHGCEPWVRIVSESPIVKKSQQAIPVQGSDKTRNEFVEMAMREEVYDVFERMPRHRLVRAPEAIDRRSKSDQEWASEGGSDDDDDDEQAINRSVPVLSLLLSIQVMDESLDLPGTDGIVVFSLPQLDEDGNAHASMIRRNLQRVGRALRFDPDNPEKMKAVLYCTSIDDKMLTAFLDSMREQDPSLWYERRPCESCIAYDDGVPGAAKPPPKSPAKTSAGGATEGPAEKPLEPEGKSPVAAAVPWNAKIVMVQEDDEVLAGRAERDAARRKRKEEKEEKEDEKRRKKTKQDEEAKKLKGVSRFSHPTFAARVADPSRDDGKDEYKRTVCIACQRWFCEIKNPNPKSKFYNTFEKPECYFLWLGDRADTPEAQAEFLAAPYKGEGGLKVGWRQKSNAACGRCMHAAKSPEAQVNLTQAIQAAQRCTAAALLPEVKHTGGGNYPTGEYRKEGKGPVLFTWSGRCCRKACADAVAKALYQHEHENVPYPEGFTPPPAAAT